MIKSLALSLAMFGCLADGEEPQTEEVEAEAVACPYQAVCLYPNAYYSGGRHWQTLALDKCFTFDGRTGPTHLNDQISRVHNNTSSPVVLFDRGWCNIQSAVVRIPPGRDVILYAFNDRTSSFTFDP